MTYGRAIAVVQVAGFEYAAASHGLTSSPPRGEGKIRRRHFSVSTRPFTNQRCISTTTATGGSIASIAVAITTFHSVSASAVTIIFLMPVTIGCLLSRGGVNRGPRNLVPAQVEKSNDKGAEV